MLKEIHNGVNDVNDEGIAENEAIGCNSDGEVLKNGFDFLRFG